MAYVLHLCKDKTIILFECKTLHVKGSLSESRGFTSCSTARVILGPTCYLPPVSIPAPSRLTGS